MSDRLLAVNGITQVKENLAEELHLGVIMILKEDEDFVKGFIWSLRGSIELSCKEKL